MFGKGPKCTTADEKLDQIIKRSRKINNKKKKKTQQQLIDNNSDVLSDKSEKPTSKNGLKPQFHRIKGYCGSNPFELAEVLRKIVCKNSERKYYRFRGGRFYGGIAAGDCVGCILDCVFCWSYKPRCNPEKIGKFYTAKHVAEKLLSIANKNNYNMVRITGNEPTLCREHLLEVLEHIPGNILFILETNGILLDKAYVRDLIPFKHHLHVRVSLKAVTEEQFKYITAMDGEFLKYQFSSLQYLFQAGISCNAAIMKELLDENNFKILVKKLQNIDESIVQNLEVEYLMMYPFIQHELARRRLSENFKPE